MIKKLLNQAREIRSAKSSAKQARGFTIIEVLIVLAIAGIILVVVLVAVPQLQRNQRNEARRSVLARIATEVGNFASNNNGKIPNDSSAAGASNFTSAGEDNGFFGRYFGCDGAGACDINIEDPSEGVPVGTGSEMDTDVGSGTGIAPSADRPGSIAYSTGVVCDGEALVTGNARNFALMMRLEGGAIACIDNK